jgi:hypothetical protein
MNKGRNHMLVRDSGTHPVLERAWSNEEVQPS